MHSSDNKENMLKESNIAFNSVNEKLKVTKFTGVEIPTYKEFYDLLDKYLKTSGEVLLDLQETIDFDESLPKNKKDESKHLYTIVILHLNNPVIRLRMYDFALKKSFSDIININDVADKEVDFMDEEYIEKAVTYMKKRIK